MPFEHVLPEGFITIGLAVLAALLLVIAVWWLWWRLPKREAARLALKIRDPKARADVEDNYRKTVGQALGGIAVLLGAASAYLQFSQQQRASDLQFSQQQRTSHDLLISSQVAKGFEQLGSEKLVVRLGGIYALEGVMNNSDQYHQAVLEALSAFVREGIKLPTTPSTPGPPTHLPADIQAALTVIGRRLDRPGTVDLAKANIPGADLTGARFAHANLTDAELTNARLVEANLTQANLTATGLTGASLNQSNLTQANLTGARLTGADLTRANLADANLTQIDLTGANLAGANLTGADLTHADLTNANLTHANLTSAHLIDANLANANLTQANLTIANLARANLTTARLADADLTGADLTTGRLKDQWQLTEACGSDVVLPTGLRTLKRCP
jgi:uncharacterized protein YjbI with pentapeptide repeats